MRRPGQRKRVLWYGNSMEVVMSRDARRQRRWLSVSMVAISFFVVLPLWLGSPGAAQDVRQESQAVGLTETAGLDCSLTEKIVVEVASLAPLPGGPQTADIALAAYLDSAFPSIERGALARDVSSWFSSDGVDYVVRSPEGRTARFTVEQIGDSWAVTTSAACETWLEAL